MDLILIAITAAVIGAVFFAVLALLDGLFATRGTVRNRTLATSNERSHAQLIVPRALRLSERTRQLVNDLERAGLALTPSEYVLSRLICCFAFGAGGYALVASFDIKGILGGVLLGLSFVFGYNAPKFYLRRRISRRVERIENQLVDALVSMAKSMRAGVGLTQALEYAGRDIGDPLGLEFQRVVRELQLGADIDVVLTEMNNRVGSADLEIVSTAIVIQRRVGGNLSEILSNVAETIRERRKIHAELHAVTAQQRLQGNLSAALPVLVAIIMFAAQPKLAHYLIDTTAGQISMAVGIFFELLGLWMVRRFAEIKV